MSLYPADRGQGTSGKWLEQGGEDAESRAPVALRLHRYRPTAPPVAGPRGRRRAALAQHEGWQTAYFLSCEQAGGRLLAVENAFGRV